MFLKACINKILSVTVAALISAAFISVSFPEMIQYVETARIRVAVYPFNDLHAQLLDNSVASVLRAGLSEQEIVEIIPVEIIKSKVYEMEPAFLWTERRGQKPRGGILWNIKSQIVEQVSERLSADYSIYGDITRAAGNWRIDVYINKGRYSRPVNTFSATGSKDENISGKLYSLSERIIGWLMSESVVTIAEEDVRRYLGGIYPHEVAVKKIIEYLKTYPESIPLHSLLFDLYMKEKDIYNEEILVEGLIISDKLGAADIKDIRYLLSLDLDPFDVVADVYEVRKDWASAIEVRTRALKIFPYKSTDHREALGRDYFHQAASLEIKGRKSNAIENYKKALTHLSASSEYSKKAMNSMSRLEGHWAGHQDTEPVRPDNR